MSEKALASVILVGALVVSFGISSARQGASTEQMKYGNPKDIVTEQKEYYPYYLKSVTNVRACESTACEVVFQLPQNYEVSLPANSLKDVPEWVGFDVDKTEFGFDRVYINKITFSAEPTQVITKTNTQVETLETFVTEDPTSEDVEELSQDYNMCNGKRWLPCEDKDYLFVCPSLGDAYCVNPDSLSNKTISNKETSYEPYISNNSYVPVIETVGQDLWDSNPTLASIEYNWKNGIFDTNNEACQTKYDNRENNPEVVFKWMVMNCGRGGYSPSTSSGDPLNREVCDSAQYDPYSGTLRITGCKQWP